jgi:hypothetical protein
MAAFIRRIWAWGLAIFLMLMIGLSRAFLGAHFFVDIVLGWLVGALILWLYIRYWDAITSWASQKSTGRQVLYALLLSLGTVLLGWIAVLVTKNFVIPETWMTNALRIGDEKPAPFAISGIITSAATLFGLLAGVALLAPRGGWQVSGPVWKRTARYVIGLIGVLIIWNGLGALFPRGESILPLSLRFVRYSLLGLWVSAGAPLFFTKLKL